MLVSSSVGSQIQPLNLARTDGTLKLDGVLDESFWNDDALLPVVQHRPDFGGEPSERTEIMMVYNSHYLLVGARLWDREQQGIQSPSKKRDELSMSNDWFGIILDSFNDKENALAFFTTPAGLRTDFAVFNDGVGDFPLNDSWNTFWDVATKKTEEGWFVEMRIPFSSLRFQLTDGDVKMGLITWRWIARKNEMISFPSIPYNWGFWSLFKPSQAQEVVFSGVTHQKPVYLAPYALAGLEFQNELNEGETAYQWHDQQKLEAGLDLKYNLTNNLTMDLTVNTDFAQVEVDDQQVNLDRFSLFFPEKRLFFQERSSVFDVSMGGSSRLFYSRRIGLNEDGDPVRILGGARLVGRLGNFDLGLIDMQTTPAQGMNGENMGVFRLRKRVFNPYSYVGGIVTNRTDFKGNFNTLYGVDGIFRIKTNDFLRVRYAQSFENGLKNQVFNLDQTRFHLNWENVSAQGLSYDIALGYHGLDYNPGLGFENREDFTELRGQVQYGWNGGETSKLLRHQVQNTNHYYLNLVHEQRETGFHSLEWYGEYKSGWWWGASVVHRLERVFEAFDIGSITVADGDYRYFYGECFGGTPGSGLGYAEAYVSVGQFFGGSRITAGIAPRWSVASGLELSGFYEYNRLHFGAEGSETVQVARIRVLWMLNTRLSVNAFVQYNSAADIWAGNFRLRYNPREGNDLYIVFNENINTDREREIPFLPVSRGHTVVVKYTHTFVL